MNDSLLRNGLSDALKGRYTLIIFDWDGTLIDSVPNIVEALKRSALELSLPVLDDAAYKGIIGLSLIPAYKVLYPDLDDVSVSAIIAAYKKHHRLLEEQASRPFSGVEEGLRVLQKSGVKLAVATGKSSVGLSRAMAANGFESFFAASRTADDARSKPDPEMLQQLLVELNVPAECVLMVGDSGFDMEMAQSAGIDRVAVTYGVQSRVEMERWKPLLIADRFDDLLHWLELDTLAEAM